MELKTKSIKGMTLALLMLIAAMAGCIGSEDETTEEEEETKAAFLDASDAGYTYASNVDNHRSLMQDLCDIKTAASENNWAEAKSIYTDGKNAEKSDGSFRTLAGFAAAEGKNHNYDTFYNQTGAIGAHIMAAMDGTGDFEGASDTVRYQGIAKLTANMGMVGYTIHELNAAVAKADAGNTDNDSGAPHNWDEGWAFFHGPDEHWSCSPAYTMKKRAADYGTETDGVSNALSASEQAMVDGLAALQAGDKTAYDAATETVVKNIIITYSQATLKYTMKMDSNESAAKYQAEGYAFWKTMEAYAAPYTDNACYNMNTHTMGWIGSSASAACDAFIWTNGSQSQDENATNDTCYNTMSHTVAAGITSQADCDEFKSMYFYENYGATSMNNVLDLTDASQLGTSYDVSAWLQPVWDHYGITAEDIGTYA
jgi:hypothetical protein